MRRVLEHRSWCACGLWGLVACSPAVGPTRAGDTPPTAAGKPALAAAALHPAAPPDPAAASPPAGGAAGPPQSSAPLSPEQCDLLAAEVRQKLREGRADPVRRTLQEGRTRCAGDNRFLVGLGWLELGTKNWQTAADVFTGVVLSPNPPMMALSGLATAYRNLDDAGRQRIRALGTQPSAPIHVPEIAAEYWWVRTFGCEEGSGRVTMQALIGGDGGDGGKKLLDRLDFTCSAGQQRALYFDFSADPMEQEMNRRLEKQPGSD